MGAKEGRPRSSFSLSTEVWEMVLTIYKAVLPHPLTQLAVYLLLNQEEIDVQLRGFPDNSGTVWGLQPHLSGRASSALLSQRGNKRVVLRGKSSLSGNMVCKMVPTSALSFPSLHLCLCQRFFGMECPKLVIRNSCRNKRKTSSKNK